MNYMSIYELKSKYKTRILNNNLIGSIIPECSNYTVKKTANNYLNIFTYFCFFNTDIEYYDIEYPDTYGFIDPAGYKPSVRTLKSHVLTINTTENDEQLMSIGLNDEQIKLLCQ